MSSHPDDRQALRRLPSVEALAATLPGLPHETAVRAAREEIERSRERLLDGADADGELAELSERAHRRARELGRPSLRRVINATGTVLHTNLGRAPLAAAAAEQVAEVATGYSNLEYDLASGGRGSRLDHLRAGLAELTGAERAIAVNNNAAAVLLALASTAAGREVIVSRGQLIEIGGSFRIPEIMELSGARLVEVGTTNRTRIADYESATGPHTAVLLRVHQSNFRAVGFVEQASIDQLAALARKRGLALIDDLGSGALEPLADEPTVRASLAAGADIVCFSADKLLGGPQAGVLCGRGDAIDACARHPFARTVRLDRLQIAALEATVRLHLERAGDAIPALAMLRATEAELAGRAGAVAEAIGEPASVTRSGSVPGGGSLPGIELEGPVCALATGRVGPDELTARLRAHDPPVIARIEEGRVILDPRTFADADVAAVAAAVVAAHGR